MAIKEPKRINQVVKEGRKRLRLTQEGLATHLNCSRSLVAQIEGGIAPTHDVLRKIIDVLSEPEKSELQKHLAAYESPKNGNDQTLPRDVDENDMIHQFMKLRASADIDLTGNWEAIWLTTTNGQENRNRETIVAKRRWNGSWEFTNKEISEDNPDGGYLWVGRLELFDNRHLLGYYCAKERRILAKGTLCLELQTNGRNIVGVWHGLSFDTMWATGLVAMCRESDNPSSLSDSLDRFIRTRPKMPY
jgi:transcriptional regulator with XRE-family HTH domain